MQGTHEVTNEYYRVTHEVGPHQTGIRLDHFLKSFYSHRSRHSIQKAIQDGRITINRNQGPHLTTGKIKPGSQLVAADAVTVQTQRKPEPPVNLNYKILFEDDEYLVIDKPSNLPVHPAGRYYFNTLLVHLQSDRELFLAHRIDKETSGVLILTKSKQACAWLTSQFRARTTEKKYLAIVKGCPPSDFIVDLPISRAQDSKISIKMSVNSIQNGGLEASTQFTRLKTVDSKWGRLSLVQCNPKTGRQHQLRVHLSHVGFPIVGDKLYSLPELEALSLFERSTLSPQAQTLLILPRHALHSCELGFPLPVAAKRSAQTRLFKSPLPDDLESFMMDPDQFGPHQWTPENSGLFLQQYDQPKDGDLDCLFPVT